MLTHTLPDITTETLADHGSSLQWVGMEGIALPFTTLIDQNGFSGTDQESAQHTIANANIYVSLDSPDAKGIHMSRLHLLVNKLSEVECNRENIEQLLTQMIESQNGISKAAKIHLSFDVLLSKYALVSENKGYQSYPVAICAEKNKQGFQFEIELTIPYSSTCPCSASLARQLYAEAINQKFSSASISKTELLDWAKSKNATIATPHSQRSFAYLKLTLNEKQWPAWSTLILNIEDMIGTPVQTAVKRSDEQAFAKLNADNLMFSEDAARRVKRGLEKLNYLTDYWFKIEHQESLHAHNAVVIDQKLRVDK